MSESNTKKIVLVGGGHTHALVLNALKRTPLHRAEVTVVNPGTTAPYSGMLPGFIAGHYTRDDLDIDLHALTNAVGARLVEGSATGIDTDARQIMLDDRQRLPFDIASIDIGITSRMAALPGFTEYAVPAKPLAGFAARWETFRLSKGPKDIAIIGGGIAGAEIAMAMAFALRDDPDGATIRLLDRREVLSNNSKAAQAHVRRSLAQNGVELLEGVDIVEITSSAVRLANGSSIPARFVVGAAGATPHSWVETTGLDLHDGFIEVDQTLQTSTPGVFAVGDCAHMTFDPRPKAGVFAVRQAPILLANLQAALSGETLQRYTPQPDYLKLVSLGGKRAYGEKAGWGLSGHLMWRLKDRIDRAFMAQF